MSSRRDKLAEVILAYEAELARLHAFTRRLAERLYLAAEVLSILAEKKAARNTRPGENHAQGTDSD